MVTCPKCNAPESGLRWQFWQGNVFRCTLCNCTFMTEVDEVEYPLPEPEGLFQVSESVLMEEREPLIDVFEENDAVRIYIEALAEIKNEMRLKVTEDRIEIAARNFCKSIDLSTYNLEREKGYYHFKNSILKITLPKKERTEVLAVAQVS